MILNLILFITGTIGYVTAGLSLKNYKLNNSVNIYMILIIIIISTRFFFMGLINFTNNDLLKYYYIKNSSISLLIIPLFFLNFKKISKTDTVFKRGDLMHLVFSIFFFIFITNISSFIIDYKYLNLVLYSLFSLYIFTYVFLIYKLLKSFVWVKKNTSNLINKQKKLNSKWTYFLFSAVLIASVRLLISVFFELNNGGVIRGFSFQWVSALIWLSVLIKILVSPEILYGYNTLYEKADENRIDNLALPDIWDLNFTKKITNTQQLLLKEKINSSILGYIEDVEKITLKDHIFRNPSISISEIANKLNIPKSHITYLFKYYSTISFSEYKKIVRIQDALRLINKDYLKENTLNYLSKKVGFPSYNTFFTSFKEVTGISPLEYHKSDRRNR
jgi:AraC-like DNA-binding protein